MRLDPALRLLEKQVTYEHHYAVDTAHDEEHVCRVVVELVKEELHDRCCDSLCKTEACNSETRSKTLTVLEPEHECLNG